MFSLSVLYGEGFGRAQNHYVVLQNIIYCIYIYRLLHLNVSFTVSKYITKSAGLVFKSMEWNCCYSNRSAKQLYIVVVFSKCFRRIKHFTKWCNLHYCKGLRWRVWKWPLWTRLQMPVPEHRNSLFITTKTYIIHKILQTAYVYGRFGVCMFVLNIHEHTFMRPAVSVVLKSETNSFSHRN